MHVVVEACCACESILCKWCEGDIHVCGCGSDMGVVRVTAPITVIIFSRKRDVLDGNFAAGDVSLIKLWKSIPC